MRLSGSLSRREAIAALVGAPALIAFEAALAGCGGRKVPATYDGEIVGGDAALGHLLLSGDLLKRPVARRERVGTAILGAGISGLSAAWRLAREGDRDFRVLELEAEPGGTARWGQNAVSRYPWAAHYVVVPVSPNPALEALLEEVGALEGRTPEGTPIYAENVLCRDPEERLFYRGEWFEGLYPHTGATRADLAELSRLEAVMRTYASRRDARGRRAFALPRRFSSDDAELTSLDRISMADWLAQNGFRARRTLWFVEYGCRDDFGSSLSETSAWAGIHYFAARLKGVSEDEPEPFLTWPEGNGRLASHLARAAAGKLVSRALVFDVAPRADGVTVLYLDATKDEVVALDAEHAVFALPKFMASRLIAPWRERPPEALAAFEYVPWFVANVTLTGRPAARGFPLAWDNVLFDSPSLGYVVATHQSLVDHGPTVFTYYFAFAGEPVNTARRKLLSATHADLAAAIVADLSRAHPDLPALISRIDVYRWGHAMARPRPGFLWGAALKEAARPLGRVRFAHTDLSGLPLFEEAQDAGVRAAESILSDRGVRFSALSA